MSSIGDIGVDMIKGLPVPTRYRVDTWQVPGLDGYGAQKLGSGDAEFDITVILYETDNANANADVYNLQQLQGELVTIVDDYGDTYNNVLVTKVDQAVKQPMIWDGHAAAVHVTIPLKCLTAN